MFLYLALPKMCLYAGKEGISTLYKKISTVLLKTTKFEDQFHEWDDVNKQNCGNTIKKKV